MSRSSILPLRFGSNKAWTPRETSGSLFLIAISGSGARMEIVREDRGGAGEAGEVGEVEAGEREAEGRVILVPLGGSTIPMSLRRSTWIRTPAHCPTTKLRSSRKSSRKNNVSSL